MLASTVLEYLTVKALDGVTLAGNVTTEPVDPLDDDFASQARPTLAVIVGGDLRDDITGKQVAFAPRSIDLTIQVYCPEQVQVTTGGSHVAVTTRSRGGGSLIVGITCRQIERTLMAGQSAAAVLWRDFVMQVRQIDAQPYIFAVKPGIRILAHEMSWTVDTIGEPAIGVVPAPDDVWGRVLTMIEADPDYASLAAWVRSEITAPEDMTAARVALAALGLNDQAGSDLGFGPVPELAGEEPATVTTIVAFGDEIDADRADEVLENDDAG